MVNFKNLLVSVAALLPAVAALPVAQGTSEDSIAGRYIITFKRGLSEQDLDDHIDYASNLHSRSLQRRGLTVRHEEGVRKRFSINEARSYSAVFDENTIRELSTHPAVAAIEADVEHTHDAQLVEIRDSSEDDELRQLEDVEYSLDGEQDDKDVEYSLDGDVELDPRADVLQQKNAPWGLTSLSFNHYSGRADVIKKYTYWSDMQGSGIFVYVVDSGIRTTHKEFEGRAIQGANFIKNETAEDYNGHGTHVAGTIGGKTYGVAKKVTVISVKVSHQGGKSTGESMLSGYEWVLADAKKRGVSKCVVNISMGGPHVLFLNKAVSALHDAGITVFTSAGNKNVDASSQSPAAIVSIFTVASITSNNKKSDFSNYGKLVDIWAPGSDIVSAGHKSDTASATMSGTSMACPHAAGVAASVKSRYGDKVAKPAQVFDRMISDSVKDIMGDTKGSVNRILSNGLASAKEVPNPNKDKPTRPPM